MDVKILLRTVTPDYSECLASKPAPRPVTLSVNRRFLLLYMAQYELVNKLTEARSLGKADPSLIDDFIKDNLERK